MLSASIVAAIQNSEYTVPTGRDTFIPSFVRQFEPIMKSANNNSGKQTMIRGWMSGSENHIQPRPAENSSRHEQQPPTTSAPILVGSPLTSSSSSLENSQPIVLEGRVIHEAPNGNMRRKIYMQGGEDQDQQTNTLVHLDAERFPQTEQWMSIKHARKLICPGIVLYVEGIVSTSELLSENEDVEEDVHQVLLASRIQVISVLPATPYLARLLSFPLETLCQLFPERGIGDAPSSSVASSGALTPLPMALVLALQPCSIQRCKEIFRLCNDERDSGRSATLFKNEALVQVCNEIREFQGWTSTRSPHGRPPRTTVKTWEALLRMEQLWCRETDGIEENLDENKWKPSQTQNTENPHGQGGTPSLPEHVDSQSHARVVYGGVDVDPSLNLPDLTDERRIRYAEERKRPQIQRMLKLIRRLTGFSDDDIERKSESHVKDAPIELHLLDIGGGRGDLANAVTAFFAQPEIQKHVSAHLTVIDINQPSLDAGKARAEASDLQSYMSFVYCDLSEQHQVEKLLSEKKKVDLVFGLHCCGGLAEAAVELAIASCAAFCVSTCCFRSNENLASLTRLSENIALSRTDHESDQIYTSLEKEDDPQSILSRQKRDRERVSTLAVLAGAQGQHRAMRAYNAMRLVAVEQRFNEIHNSSTSCGSVCMRTWQESFPIEFSVQNRIMVGTPI